MTRLLSAWLKVHFKALLFLIAASLSLGIGAVWFQEQKAGQWQNAQPEQIELWSRNTKMELIQGEANPWNEYINALLSDLSMLHIYWQNPIQYETEIVKSQNAFYEKALQDPGYCRRALNLDETQIKQKLELAEAYQEKNWKQPLNPEKPRADYMVYLADHTFSWMLLLDLAVCCGIGVWLWASMFESRSYFNLFVLPYSKQTVFASFLILTAVLPLLFLFIQYGTLWTAGFLLEGNAPLFLIETNQIIPCLDQMLHSLPYPVLFSFFFSCLSAVVSAWIRDTADSLMLLVMALMVVYFFMTGINSFTEIHLWVWLALIVVSLLCIVLSWRRYEYEA